jgi:thioredoxin 1
MEHLTKESFKEKVFNFEINQDWKFEGSIPCVVDFYADWCMPCELFTPLLEEMSKEYQGRINIYKVDTDEEEELSAIFEIKSIPSLLFCPLEGEPQMTVGALARTAMVEAMNNILPKSGI